MLPFKSSKITRNRYLQKLRESSLFLWCLNWEGNKTVCKAKEPGQTFLWLLFYSACQIPGLMFSSIGFQEYAGCLRVTSILWFCTVSCNLGENSYLWPNPNDSLFYANLLIFFFLFDSGGHHSIPNVWQSWSVFNSDYFWEVYLPEVQSQHCLSAFAGAGVLQQCFFCCCF